MTTRPVTSCADCPAYDWARERCNLSGGQELSGPEYGDVWNSWCTENPCAPSWCPLRSGPITLTLEGK